MNRINVFLASAAISSAARRRSPYIFSPELNGSVRHRRSRWRALRSRGCHSRSANALVSVDFGNVFRSRRTVAIAVQSPHRFLDFIQNNGPEDSGNDLFFHKSRRSDERVTAPQWHVLG